MQIRLPGVVGQLIFFKDMDIMGDGSFMKCSSVFFQTNSSQQKDPAVLTLLINFLLETGVLWDPQGKFHLQ